MAQSASISYLIRSAQGYSSIPQTDEERHPSLYHPLNIEKREIRILTILPSRSLNKPLQCHLSTTSLLAKRPEKFEALSYVLGAPDFSAPITINGEERFITQTLQSALFHIRRKWRRRTIWVDQICINQADIEERGSQVQLMRYIYGLAENVLSYVGEMESAKEAGLIYDAQKWLGMARRRIPLMAMLLIEPPEFWTLKGIWESLELKLILIFGFLLVWMFKNVEPIKELARVMREEEAKFLLHVLEGAKVLYETSYWSRCWILQEVVLSQKTPVLMYGGHAFKDLDPPLLVELLGERINILIKREEPGRCPVAIHKLFSALYSLPTHSTSAYSLRKSRQTESDLFAFSHLLQVTARLRSTEFLDKFYCFYGLLKDNHLFPAPDYAASRPLEARKLIAAMIKNEGRWDVYDFLTPSTDPSYSSWTPAQPTHPDIDQNALYRYFSWGNDPLAFPNLEYSPAISPCLTFIGASGFRVGTVTAISQLPAAEPLEELINAIGEFECIVSEAVAQPLTEGVRGMLQALRYQPSKLQGVFEAIAEHKRDPDFKRHFTTLYRYLSCFLFAGIGNEAQGRMYRLQDGCGKLARQTLVCTSEGFFGFTDAAVREGDIVAILAGLRQPYVLREDRESVPADVVYRLVRSAFVSGVMQGEYVDIMIENAFWDLEEKFAIR